MLEGKIEISQHFLTRRNSRRNLIQYNSDIYGSNFLPTRQKHRCNVYFLDNCFSKEKTVTSSVNPVVFNIYLSARCTHKSRCRFRFCLFFFLSNLHIDEKNKKKNPLNYASPWTESFQMRHTLVKSKIELEI